MTRIDERSSSGNNAIFVCELRNTCRDRVFACIFARSESNSVTISSDGMDSMLDAICSAVGGREENERGMA